MMSRKQCVAALVTVALAMPALADQVILKTGDTFSGTIARITPEAVEVETTFAGKLSVKREAIKTLRSEKKVTVVDAGGATRAAFIAPVAEGAGWRETDAMAPVIAVAPVAAPPAAPAPQKAVFLDLERYYLPVGPHWKNQFALGVVNTTGNTEQTNFAAEAAFNFKEAPHELTLKIGGVYDVTEGKQTAGQFYFDTVYRRRLPEWDASDRWYLFAENHELYDAIKGISYRITNGVGLGYYVIKSDKLNLDLRAGPAHVCERFFSGETESAISGLAGLRASYVINERTTLTEEILYTVSFADTRNYQIGSETALSLKLPELARGAGLKFSFRDDYDNSAKAGKQNDTRLVLAVTLDF